MAFIFCKLKNVGKNHKILKKFHESSKEAKDFIPSGETLWKSLLSWLPILQALQIHENESKKIDQMC